MKSKKFLRAAFLAATLAASASADTLLVTGWLSQNVPMYDLDTGQVLPTSIAASAGGLSLPHAIVLGPDNLFYVGSVGTNNVLRFDRGGNFVDEFIPAALGGLSAPTSLLFRDNGNLLVASFNNSLVLEYDPDGNFIGRFDQRGRGLLGPEFITFGPDGNLYVVGQANNGVLRYNGRTGTFIDFFAAGANAPHGCAFGPDGNLYVASFGRGRVVKFDGTTGARIGPFIRDDPNTPEDETGGLSSAHNLDFDSAGNLYVASFGTSSVMRYDGVTGAFIDEFVPPGFGDLNSPTGLVILRDPPCIGDITGDGQVDIVDLSVQLAHFGFDSGATFEEGDLDGDGDIDLADLSLMLSLFGSTCD